MSQPVWFYPQGHCQSPSATSWCMQKQWVVRGLNRPTLLFPCRKILHHLTLFFVFMWNQHLNKWNTDSWKPESERGSEKEKENNQNLWKRSPPDQNMTHTETQTLLMLNKEVLKFRASYRVICREKQQIRGTDLCLLVLCCEQLTPKHLSIRFFFLLFSVYACLCWSMYHGFYDGLSTLCGSTVEYKPNWLPGFLPSTVIGDWTVLHLGW